MFQRLAFLYITNTETRLSYEEREIRRFYLNQKIISFKLVIRVGYEGGDVAEKLHNPHASSKKALYILYI